VEHSVPEPKFPDPSGEHYVVSPPADCESHLDGPLVLPLLSDEIEEKTRAVRACCGDIFLEITQVTPENWL
jgi:hypothetical protein